MVSSQRIEKERNISRSFSAAAAEVTVVR